MKVEIGRPGHISCALTDVDRLDDFRVVVDHATSVDDASAAMATAGAGELLGSGDVWVSISWLRSQLAGQGASFWIDFDGMVSYADSQGWLSVDRTALRAHVEYRDLKQAKRVKMAQFHSRFSETNGLKMHYLEAGEGGYPMVLLHSGEYGGCAESSWGTVIPVLASAGFHVYAPDWLGFGQSDKVVDFANAKGRRLQHMGQFIQDLCLPELPVIVGNSMGGTYLIQELANGNKAFMAAAAVVVSGGGFVPDNEARRAIQEYDLTKEGMRRILGVLLHDRKWIEDEDFVAWRHELSLVPGAWQCAAAARLNPPGPPNRGTEFGKDDRTRYEDVSCPTLVVAGAEDPLRLPDYALEISRRIPSSELLTYEKCGHMPNIEFPERFAKDVVKFSRKFVGSDQLTGRTPNREEQSAWQRRRLKGE